MRVTTRTTTTVGLIFSVLCLYGCGGSRGVLLDQPTTPTGGGTGGGGGGTGGGGGGNGGGVQPGDTQGPTIANAQATLPAGFRWTGGDVTVSADVTDPSGLKSVTATVMRQKTSAASQVALAAGTGTAYAGTYAAAANVNNDGVAESYSVTVTATDNADNVSTATTAFQVPAATAPQNPPGL